MLVLEERILYIGAGFTTLNSTSFDNLVIYITENWKCFRSTGVAKNPPKNLALISSTWCPCRKIAMGLGIPDMSIVPGPPHYFFAGRLRLNNAFAFVLQTLVNRRQPSAPDVFGKLANHATDFIGPICWAIRRLSVNW